MFLAWRNPLPLTTTWKLSETKAEKVHAPSETISNMHAHAQQWLDTYFLLYVKI